MKFTVRVPTIVESGNPVPVFDEYGVKIGTADVEGGIATLDLKKEFATRLAPVIDLASVSVGFVLKVDPVKAAKDGGVDH